MITEHVVRGFDDIKIAIAEAVSTCEKLSSFCGVMITITCGASVAVWFMKISVISDCTVRSFANMVAELV